MHNKLKVIDRLIFRFGTGADRKVIKCTRSRYDELWAKIVLFHLSIKVRKLRYKKIRYYYLHYIPDEIQMQLKLAREQVENELKAKDKILHPNPSYGKLLHRLKEIRQTKKYYESSLLTQEENIILNKLSRKIKNWDKMGDIIKKIGAEHRI